MKAKRGQSLLEATISITVMVALLGGIINIWLWGNNQIVARQQAYESGRVAAGTASDGYSLQWPVYSPPSLTEGMVLTGSVLDYSLPERAEEPRK
ncbi:MAG: hypothetical protein FJZ09_06655 [Candidatus Omnitrophica bacterium]|nr:hypothetical protein [Candidatus Omnitrophota bacterium]